MLTTMVLLALAAIAALLLHAARAPDRFRVTRTAVIKAPAARIFSLINDLQSFNTWSPYLRRDPRVQGHYSGPAGGVGAAYTWQGRKIGSGTMTITDSQAPIRLAMRLDFVKPFKAQNTAEFTLQAEGDNLTIVSWALHGPAPYVSRLMATVVDMDRIIGKDFEAGLANLKSLTQGR
jgi:uncharacterized protein YndB with AHSA1/START domain